MDLGSVWDIASALGLFAITVVLPLLALLLVAGLTFFVLRRLRRRAPATA